MRHRINKLALKGLITMLGGSSADAARFMAATSVVFSMIESRQRFILKSLPPSDGYRIVTEMMGAAFPDSRVEGVFPVKDRHLALEGTKPWVRESARFGFTEYLRKTFVQDTHATYSGLIERARLAGGLPLASTMTWSAVCIPARNALERSLSKRAYAEFGDNIFVGLQVALPTLVCCIVGGDEEGIHHAKAVLKLFTAGWLPLGHFPCGNSRAFLTM